MDGPSDLSRVTELCVRYSAFARESAAAGEAGAGDPDSRLPSLSVFRRTAPSDIETYLYEPVLCLILQGSKTTSIGDRLVALRPGDALLVSHDLPVVSRITEASVDRPYLAAILALDLGLARSLYTEVAETRALDGPGRALSVGPAEPTWLAPLVRYLGLMDSPLDARVLGPSFLREIHYRLLLSSIGRTLRDLLVADSHASRIAKAIGLMRSDFRAPLRVSDLARTVGMSASSFHQHFKAVTGTTPLQYQKDLRLIAARGLLVERNQSVSEAAFAVGYESPTHFSRDYSRKFGAPPSQAARAVLPA